MSLSNDSLLEALGQEGYTIYDGLAAPNASSQNTATKLIGQACRVTTSVANGSLILPSILSNEASPLVYVINDSPNAVLVYPFLSSVTPEKMNTTNNASLSIPAGGWGHFIKTPAQTKKGGGTQGTINWSASAAT